MLPLCMTKVLKATYLKEINMKKIFSMALFALLAAGFAGCAGAKPEAAPAKVQNQGQQPDVLKADENGVIAVDQAPVAE